jgi:hypothetical protein
VTGDVVSAMYGNHYELFTPGPSGGGRYLIYVTPPYREGPARYSLRVAPAFVDDTGAGRLLRDRSVVRGTLDPRGIDIVDLYHFRLPGRSDILLTLGQYAPKAVELLLMRDDRHEIAGGQAFRLELPAGDYVVAVQASPGGRAVRYTIRLRVHEVSRVSLDTRTVELGVPAIVRAEIGRPSGRDATLQLDRLDPVEGWVFVHAYELPVGSGRLSSLIWEPPGVGYYRFRITSPSRSGYAYEEVMQPS